MIKLNGVEYYHRAGVSLQELVDEYNLTNPKIGLDEFVVVINSTPLTSLQAQERILQENDDIRIVPFLPGG